MQTISGGTRSSSIRADIELYRLLGGGDGRRDGGRVAVCGSRIVDCHVESVRESAGGAGTASSVFPAADAGPDPLGDHRGGGAEILGGELADQLERPRRSGSGAGPCCGRCTIGTSRARRSRRSAGELELQHAGHAQRPVEIESAVGEEIAQRVRDQAGRGRTRSRGARGARGPRRRRRRRRSPPGPSAAGRPAARARATRRPRRCAGRDALGARRGRSRPADPPAAGPSPPPPRSARCPAGRRQRDRW